MRELAENQLRSVDAGLPAREACSVAARKRLRRALDAAR